MPTAAISPACYGPGRSRPRRDVPRPQRPPAQLFYGAPRPDRDARPRRTPGLRWPGPASPHGRWMRTDKRACGADRARCGCWGLHAGVVCPPRAVASLRAVVPARAGAGVKPQETAGPRAPLSRAASAALMERRRSILDPLALRDRRRRTRLATKRLVVATVGFRSLGLHRRKASASGRIVLRRARLAHGGRGDPCAFGGSQIVASSRFGASTRASISGMERSQATKTMRCPGAVRAFQAASTSRSGLGRGSTAKVPLVIWSASPGSSATIWAVVSEP